MISPKQKRVFDFVSSYTEKKEYPPSLDEIRKKLKLRSIATVHQHLTALEKKGYIERKKNQPRMIRIVTSTSPTRIPIWNINIKEPKLSNRATYQKLPLDRIICGDTILELKKLPPESCDIIVIDPPYNIGKDFGNNIDRRELAEYVAWCKQWIDDCIRVLKPSGTMFVYGFSEILAYLSIEIPLEKRWLIWHYTNKNVASLNFWQRSHESIICAWKNKPNFNRDLVREPYTEGFLNGAAGKKRKGTIGRFSKNGQETVYKAHEGGALPRDVIKIPALAGGAGMTERWFLCKTCKTVYEPRQLQKHLGHEVTKHPTQKPLELTKKLIRSAMPEKDGIVLIPFVGSGSECVAVKELGLSYIGIELNPDYVDLANGWLKQIHIPNRLF